MIQLNIKHKKVKMFCNKHKVNYQAIQILLYKKLRLQPCPRCMDEAFEKLSTESAEKSAKERFEIFLLQQGKIPPRHINCTFDNYIVTCEGQEKAKRITQTYAKDILNNKSHGLILSGRPGNGKNHLACAIAINCLKKGRKAQIWTVKSMIDAIRDTYGATTGKTTRQVVSEFKSLPLLIIDEIKRYDEKECELLFDIMNDRYLEEKPTVIISNLGAAEIKQAIGEAAVDRLREGRGKFISFDWGSYR